MGVGTGKTVTGKLSLGSGKESWITFVQDVGTPFFISTRLDQNL